MKRILLVCSAGMSTSLLVSKMQAAAKAQGIDCTINAVGEAELKKHEHSRLWNNEWGKSIKASAFNEQ